MSQVPRRKREAKQAQEIAKATGQPVAKPEIDVSDLLALRPAKAGIGRGHGYGRDFKRALLDKLAGGVFLSDICAVPGMPSEFTVMEWCKNDEEFADLYEKAKPHRARALVETALTSISGDHDRDTIIVASRKADVMLKVAALFDPSRYSPNAHAALVRSGGVGSPVSISINIGKDQESEIIDITPQRSAIGGTIGGIIESDDE